MDQHKFNLLYVRLTGIGLFIACVVVGLFGYQVGKDVVAALVFRGGSYIMAGVFVVECCILNEDAGSFKVLWNIIGFRMVVLLLLWFPVLMNGWIRDVVVGMKPSKDDT